MPDSTRQRLDSLIETMAKGGQCRITMKVTGPAGDSHYFGYDGRKGQVISDFSQPVEIGSCSKMFTATSILQLVEQKKIGLEDKLTDLLDQPELLEGLMVTDSADYLGEVRLKNLLNHTSGLPEYFVDDDEMEVGIHGDSTLRFTPAQLVGMAKRLHEPQFRPGEKFKYTNTNYILLGMILKQYSGKSYQEYIGKNILEKAGMKQTDFPSITYIPGRAPGHWNKNPSEMPATLAGAAGEMVSTLDDMDLFIRAWARGEFYTSRETMEEIRTQYFSPMGGGIEYGLGTINLFGTYGHAGQTFGFQSYIGSMPNGSSFVFAIDDAAIPAWGLAMGVQGAIRDLK
jgi:D-alanyl-D-alanine carboxypeptidase